MTTLGAKLEKSGFSSVTCMVCSVLEVKRTTLVRLDQSLLALSISLAGYPKYVGGTTPYKMLDEIENIIFVLSFLFVCLFVWVSHNKWGM